MKSAVFDNGLLHMAYSTVGTLRLEEMGRVSLLF